MEKKNIFIKTTSVVLGLMLLSTFVMNTSAENYKIMPFVIQQENLHLNLEQTEITSNAVTPDNKDLLDQEQLEHEYIFLDVNEHHPYWYIPIYDYFELTQSFIPTLRVLSRINVQLATLDSPAYDLMISIHDSSGKVLLTVNITADMIPDYTTCKMTVVNIPDVRVIPGEKYYIGMLCPDMGDFDGDDTPVYGWAFGENTSYTRGEANIDFGHGVDFLFQTFGTK